MWAWLWWRRGRREDSTVAGLSMCSGDNKAEPSTGCVGEVGGVGLCLAGWQESQRVGWGSSGVTVSVFHRVPLS